MPSHSLNKSNNDFPPLIEERILVAAKIMVNMLAEALLHEEEKSITPLNFRILDMVYHGTDKPTEIAKMFSIIPSTLTSVLEKLENKGFLTRDFSQTDRRRVILKLTKKGKNFVEKVNSFRMAQIDEVLKNMDEDVKKQLRKSLSVFIATYYNIKEERD